MVPARQPFKLTTVYRVIRSPSVPTVRLHCWRIQVFAKVSSDVASLLQQVAVVRGLEGVDSRIHTHATTG